MNVTANMMEISNRAFRQGRHIQRQEGGGEASRNKARVEDGAEIVASSTSVIFITVDSVSTGGAQRQAVQGSRRKNYFSSL